MITLKKIKARCDLIGGHWLWNGAVSGGVPNLWAPDYTAKGGENATQRGPRAVWHLKHRKPIPEGSRIFRKATCQEPLCVNPTHVECLPCKEWGARMADSGIWRGNLKRSIASRRTGRARSKLDAQKLEIMRNSPEKTGRTLARELNASRSAISRFRSGKALAFEPVGGLFTGLLMAANDGARRAA